MDDVEDSEEEVANRAGSGRRGVPRKDNKFEERLEDIRRRIRRKKLYLLLSRGSIRLFFFLRQYMKETQVAACGCCAMAPTTS